MTLYRRLSSRASPLRLFESLYAGERYAFLYESLESRGNRGRYSFLGARPRAIWRSFGDGSELEIDGRVSRDAGPPLEALRKLIVPIDEALPVAPFCGGAVGYLGYDTVRWCERIPDTKPRDATIPAAQLLLPGEVLCFDHLEQVVHVLLFSTGDAEQRFQQIEAAISNCPSDPEHESHDASRVKRSDPNSPPDTVDRAAPPLRSNMTREQFCALVERAQEYIRAGDIFQVVLSQRFDFDLSCDPLGLYRALRVTNPSPYMYYLRLDDLHVAGSSPEVLVRMTGRKVVTRPLAGTRRRGATPGEDDRLAAELLADPKERAEHVMLVDLGRNDLGRVCEFGSVKLTDIMDIERHSRVMHMVSSVEGWRRGDLDALDVYRAVFPAGTVSGAPKVRAMEIIEELEPTRRGIYAGAIGYFSLLGDLDLCIAIRTIVMHGGKGYIQAGAGVVADSVPLAEYEETLNKANALVRAVALAGATPTA